MFMSHDKKTSKFDWTVKTVIELGADPNAVRVDFRVDERVVMSLLRHGAELNRLLKTLGTESSLNELLLATLSNLVTLNLNPKGFPTDTRRCRPGRLTPSVAI